MITKNQLEELETLARQKQWAQIKQRSSLLQAADVAEIFEHLDPASRVLFYRSLHRPLAADTFSYLDETAQATLLKQFNDAETRELVSNLSPDDRTELFEELPAAATQRLLNLLPQADRREALMLLGYPEDTVARLMTPEFACITPDLTVDQALASVRKQAMDSETINMIYVVDEEGRLIDEVRLRRLLLASGDKQVAELLDHSYRSLTAWEHEDAAVALMKRTGLFALPVTDADGVLLGVVTADDVLDVAVEGATEDIHKGGAISPLEVGYLKAPIRLLVANRVGWLLALVFINILSGAGIAHYEELIDSVVALVFFLPLLIASGGNVGAQAATLVIRGMALGEVMSGDFWRVMLRELSTSLILSVAMALAVFGIAWWRTGIEIAVVVALSMICIVLLGGLVGMALPFILRQFGQDPASASAPLVTSIADISGVLIYLGIASLMLGSMIGA